MDGTVSTSRRDVGRFLAGVAAGAVLLAGGALALLVLIATVMPGWQATVVGSGSMRPALEVGDVALVRAWEAPEAPGPPTVVLMERPGLDPLLHRVVGNDGELIVTKGDANEDPDSDPVSTTDVIGAARLLVPGVGSPSVWLAEGRLGHLAALAAALAALLWLARFGWLNRYDPWPASSARARPEEADRSGGPGPGAPDDRPAEAAHPAGSSAPAVHGERTQDALTTRAPGGGSVPSETYRPTRPSRGRGSVRARRIRVVLVVLVTLVTVFGMGRADAALTGATSFRGSFTAGVLEPPTGMTATVCQATVTPQVVSATGVGPYKSAFSMPKVEAGDTLLFLVGAIEGGGGSPGAHPLATHGWSMLADAGGQNRIGGVWHRTVAAGESGRSVPFRSDEVGLLFVVRGGTVRDGAKGNLRAAAFTLTSPSVPGAAGSLLLTLWGTEARDATLTRPPGMRSVGSYRPSTTVTFAAHRQTLSTGNMTEGKTGTRSTTASVAANNASFSVVLDPGPPSGTRVAWSPSPSSKVTGYEVSRAGQAATLPATARRWDDPANATAGTTYSVRALYRSWRSEPASVRATTGSCP